MVSEEAPKEACEAIVRAIDRYWETYKETREREKAKLEAIRKGEVNIFGIKRDTR